MTSSPDSASPETPSPESSSPKTASTALQPVQKPTPSFFDQVYDHSLLDPLMRRLVQTVVETFLERAADCPAARWYYAALALDADKVADAAFAAGLPGELDEMTWVAGIQALASERMRELV